ncbi:MAG: hypothetical protein IIZ82_02175 [Clostridia bacterium]|nr:hypothetical protein [Clostridia bacterium]
MLLVDSIIVGDENIIVATAWLCLLLKTKPIDYIILTVAIMQTIEVPLLFHSLKAASYARSIPEIAF